MTLVPWILSPSKIVCQCLHLILATLWREPNIGLGTAEFALPPSCPGLIPSLPFSPEPHVKTSLPNVATTV